MDPGSTPKPASRALTAALTEAVIQAAAVHSAATSVIRCRTARWSARGKRWRSSPTASARAASAALSDDGGVTQHDGVVQVVDQLVVQATVGLPGPVDRDESEDAAVLALEYTQVDQVVLHAVVRSSTEVADPVAGVVRPCSPDLGQSGVQQRLAGRFLEDHGHVPVGRRDTLPHREIEEQCAAEPEVEVERLDQQPIAGDVESQQVQVLRERDHDHTVVRSPRAE